MSLLHRPPRPKRPTSGEFWHVRLPDNVALTTVKVSEVTESTVLVKFDAYSNGTRYKTSDLEWVEKSMQTVW